MSDQKVILTTTCLLDGYRVVRYLGVEAIYLHDFDVKKRAKALKIDFKREQTVVAFEVLQEEIKKTAQSRGCNGVIGANFNILPLGHRGHPVEGYVLYGTLVELEKE